LGDFENRYEPTLVDNMMAPDSTLGSSQNKKNIMSIIKRSKSKETNAGGSITQRGTEEMKFSQTMNI